MKKPTKDEMGMLVAIISELIDQAGVKGVRVCEDAENPYWFALVIPRRTDESAVLQMSNVLFHILGLLPDDETLEVGETNDFCCISPDCDAEGNYAAIFNHPAILNLPENAPERCFILKNWDDCDAWDEEESIEEMRKHYRDFLIPIPPPPKSGGEEVFLTLKYEFYDAIKAGEKKTEYREYTPNWVKKLIAAKPKRVKFQRGYGGPGRLAPEQMVWTVKGVWLFESDTGMKGDPWNPPEGIVPDSIAIELGKKMR